MNNRLYILMISFCFISFLFYFCYSPIDYDIASDNVVDEGIFNSDSYTINDINDMYFNAYNDEVNYIVNKDSEEYKDISEVFNTFDNHVILGEMLKNKYPSYIYKTLDVDLNSVSVVDSNILVNITDHDFDFTIDVLLVCEVDENFVFVCDRDKSSELNLNKLDPEKPTVALTFDDGPTNNTSLIVDVLNEYDVDATFFMLGVNMAMFPSVFESVYSSGYEIGNHTYSHPYLTRISNSNKDLELNKTNELYKAISGTDLTLLRPTYGSYSKALLDSTDYIFVNWSIDSRDWAVKNSSQIVKNVLDDVSDGDIILLHDIHLSTANAIEDIVVGLMEKGYQITSVSELARIKGENLETNKLYRYFK